jgi:hypothetical protein
VTEPEIAPVNFKEGYQGKVLLVRISGGNADDLLCLRGGDDWHWLILANTQAEIQDLGYVDSEVVPAGGAAIRFEANGDIILYGHSDTYGVCDKKIAADLLSKHFPDHEIWISS